MRGASIVTRRVRLRPGLRLSFIVPPPPRGNARLGGRQRKIRCRLNIVLAAAPSMLEASFPPGGTRMGHRRFTVDVAQAELATPDELRALQLERLRASLVRVYERVPHYRAKFDAAGVHPGDLRSLADLARFPFTDQGRPARELSVRHVRGAAAQGGAHPRLERHDRPADRRRLHAARHRHLGRPDGALAPRGGRVRDGHHPQRVRLRPLHRRPGRALRRRAARRDRGADVGRPDRAPGPADPRLRADAC